MLRIKDARSLRERSLFLRHHLFPPLLFFLLSWAHVQTGVALGHAYIQPGDGYPHAGAKGAAAAAGLSDIDRDLFRFDSYYYLSIADSGYEYNGDPASSPNLVFAPLFPLAVDGFTRLTGSDSITLGFALNKILLLASLVLLFLALSPWCGRRETALALVTLSTSAGNYAFHAFYSESMTLFCLSLALFGYQKKSWRIFALAGCGIGAARLAAAPIATVIALILLHQAWRERRRFPAWLEFIGLASLSLSGIGGYLLFVTWNYGNAFEVLDAIQKNSWGRFHAQVDLIDFVSGRYLWEDVKAAAAKGFSTFTDIQTLNLVWMLLGLTSCLYLLFGWRRHLMSFLFIPYAVFICYTTVSSPFHISSHRFFAVMVPIFLMLPALHRALAATAPAWAVWLAVTAPLVSLNAGYGLLHAALFNQGVWFWF